MTMPAYLIFVRDEVVDAASHDEYLSLAPATFAGTKGRLVAFDNNPVVKEGAKPDGVVIVEWPTIEEALSHYESEAYQRIVDLRTGGAKGRLLIVNGLD